jgi:hypothetical protein
MRNIRKLKDFANQNLREWGITKDLILRASDAFTEAEFVNFAGFILELMDTEIERRRKRKEKE